jgi:hypothetical protein
VGGGGRTEHTTAQKRSVSIQIVENIVLFESSEYTADINSIKKEEIQFRHQNLSLIIGFLFEFHRSQFMIMIHSNRVDITDTKSTKSDYKAMI